MSGPGRKPLTCGFSCIKRPKCDFPTTLLGLHHDIDTIHLDRGYWGARVDRAAADIGVTDVVRPPKRKPSSDAPAEPASAPLGLRWTVERTNSWPSNYGQLRRNTDRLPEHRHAQLALAVALIITIKLIDHNNRRQPH